MEIVDGIAANAGKGTVPTVFELVKSCGARRVLDAPAGRGALSNLLHRAGLDTVALELDRSSFEASGVECVEGDLDARLPFEDNSFDCVASVEGIEHLKDPFGFVREAARVVRPSGHLVLSTPNITAWRSRARYLVTGFHNKGKRPLTEESPNPLHHINLLSYPALRYILAQGGFRVERVTTNRVKLMAYPYALLYPFVAFGTWFAMRREKDRRQRELNRAIYRHLLSWPLTMGESMIVLASRKPPG